MEVTNSEILLYDEEKYTLQGIAVGQSSVKLILGNYRKELLTRVVTNDDIDYLSIVPPEEDFVPYKGSSTIQVLAHLVNGEIMDYTEYAILTSADKDRIVVDNSYSKRGVLYGKGLGPSLVFASVGKIRASAVVNVSFGCISLNVNPSNNLLLYKGIESSIRIECVQGNGSVVDKTAEAEITLNSEFVEFFSSGEEKGKILPVERTVELWRLYRNGTVFR